MTKNVLYRYDSTAMERQIHLLDAQLSQLKSLSKLFISSSEHHNRKLLKLDT